MIGYIYITTNLVNNKKYIGKRVSKIFLENKYLGSGVLLQKAVQKYGKDKFSVELIEECNSLEELMNREEYWILKYNAVENDNFYNLSYGKEGINGRLGYKHSQECKDKISKSNSGKIRTINHKLKIAETLKAKHHIWITNGKEELSIPEKELNTYINQGFYKGRKPITESERVHLTQIHKEVASKLTDEERQLRYGVNKGKIISEEIKDKISKSCKGKNTWSEGRVWIHKNTTKQCINIEELEYYLQLGWHRGMYADKCKLCSSTTIESIV